MSTKLTINNKKVDIDADSDTPLLWAIRDEAGLTGTKFGCGIAQCGACTVHLNGRATRSCVLPISALGNAEITTIEGLTSDEASAVKEAWEELAVAQCGYCQSGQIMSATALLESNKAPTAKEIETSMSGNICRCSTYTRIRAGIELAAKKLAKEA